MASGTASVKIIIAGAGVAGLSLAAMLEKVGIDYVILEGHGAVAPPVGASIGLFPNGLRLLDQVGCSEPLMKLGDPSPGTFFIRDEEGKPLLRTPSCYPHSKIRYGYKITFFDRQWLLQSIYDQLQFKDRVLVDQRVMRIDHTEKGVQVTTKKGDTFHGTMVVGADGVYSAVRHEMHRIGNELAPGYFPANEESRVPCYFLCSFGIAQDVPGWVQGEICTVIGKEKSNFVLSGGNGRLYWIFFKRMPQVKYGKDIPKCTKEMEAEFLEEHGDTPVTTQVTFRQIVSKRLFSTLTPLHEFVYQKWFFKRIVTIGDSAHKPNPITGQGGNGAIEAAAEFVNALMRKKDQLSGDLTRMTEGDIQQVFAEMQAAQHARATTAVWKANTIKMLYTFKWPFLSNLAWKWILPMKGPEFFFSMLMETSPSGPRVDKLPVPHRPRALPFDDELPAKPLKSVLYGRLLFVGLMCLHILVTLSTPLTDEPVTETWGDSGNVSVALTGIPPIDWVMRVLISAFSFIVLSDDPKPKLHAIYFLSQLLSPILIYTIEGYRLGNMGTPLAVPSLFLCAMQLRGAWKIAPVYALLHGVMSFRLPPSRFIEPEVATALLPAITVGYLIPTIMMFVPTPNSEGWQTWIAIWQLSPLLVSLLTYLISKALILYGRPKMLQEEEDRAKLDRYNDVDEPGLSIAYTSAIVMQATVHVTTLAYAYSHPDISIFDTFFNVPSLLQSNWNLSDSWSYFSIFFKYDLLVAVSAWAFSHVHTIWDLRRSGYITTKTGLAAVAGMLLGHLLIGPGATWVGLWYWREKVFMGLKKLW